MLKGTGSICCLCLLLSNFLLQGCNGFHLRRTPLHSGTTKHTLLLTQNTPHLLRQLLSKERLQKKWQLKKICPAPRCFALDHVSETIENTPTDFSSFLHYQSISLTMRYHILDAQQRTLLTPSPMLLQKNIQQNTQRLLAQAHRLTEARLNLYEKFLDNLLTKDPNKPFERP